MGGNKSFLHVGPTHEPHKSNCYFEKWEDGRKNRKGNKSFS